MARTAMKPIIRNTKVEPTTARMELGMLLD
jgi:hypothetical protein